MDLITRLMVFQTLFRMLVWMAMDNFTLEHLPILDQAIKSAFEQHNCREQSDDSRVEHLKNGQKNQGI